jgi:hypothetical protein
MAIRGMRLVASFLAFNGARSQPSALQKDHIVFLTS